ncbi:HD-like signal output (HDOD) protein [Clostridium saccharoperbutylacetonicum]|uniref:Stage 0 sporulation protein A homolog n=1 Tax=Clostridium saccharoperbutylacetonicum N1-4(HMT) TaxID=931276 RepID=M1MXQ6_9CLOT|nr:HDOD domain-containing protein [Clostridium saccharoperbutylacetonicum]AGF56207.1 putative signal transduction protein [Clostridium saccharoperbutylacetonicum N1-4(HMT)]NRT63051.1 HD-like signal output (HDOD) protein [Clostridium saccharoperbutylacetonicum]NSB26408.1 HD-like signal output (HDOD) protein [Clostridium saccharoperbutylacetonicum]NSB45761.1 HD-like signal output (HDOD) protein [Clostridium saccharoperbutylacetonicum]
MEKILFVDDEAQILKACRRLFVDSKYDVITAQSGEEALNILKDEEIDIIVSDMKMPYMSGYELLSKVKELYPDIIRIILSGFSDEKVVFEALQKNIAKLYILKPWENDVLINTLEKVLQLEKVLKNNNILKLINKAEELPTIKTSYEKIIKTIDSEKEIHKIVEAIEGDYSIASKLLHIVNSSYYGIKTGSVQRAVSYLGVDNIKNIVIASAFIDSLKFDPRYSKRLALLWKQSFVSNRIFNIIYNEFLNKKIPEIAMTAGLLCNVGIVFMINFYKDTYIEMFDSIKKKGEDITELENKVFGTNHQEIGGYLLRWWDIPIPVVEAAIYHHNPFDDNIINKEITCIAHIAEKYAWDVLEEIYIGKFSENVFEVLGIDKALFERKLKDNMELTGMVGV